MHNIKLNCDMGEGFGVYQIADDEAIMPYIDMANLACGFHASDPKNMYNSVALANKHNVSIGAHPSYPDLLGFGRRSMKLEKKELIATLIYQISALEGICKVFNTSVSYIKPHGALYNDMMSDINIFEHILTSIYLYNNNLPLMILSKLDNKEYIALAKTYNIKLLYEVFADRNYNDDGYLISRQKDNAIIKDEEEIKQRLEDVKKGFIYSVSKKKLVLPCDSLCVHSDHPNAIKFIELLRSVLIDI